MSSWHMTWNWKTTRCTRRANILPRSLWPMPVQRSCLETELTELARTWYMPVVVPATAIPSYTRPYICISNRSVEPRMVQLILCRVYVRRESTVHTKSWSTKYICTTYNIQLEVCGVPKGPTSLQQTSKDKSKDGRSGNPVFLMHNSALITWRRGPGAAGASNQWPRNRP